MHVHTTRDPKINQVSFRWTGNARRPITKYKFQSLRVKNLISRAVRSYKGCLEIPTVVDLTKESASMRASTVSHSRSTMC